MSAPLATESITLPYSGRRVFVVETWLKNPGRWYSWAAHTIRTAAWENARNCRQRYPESKFRVTTYVSTKS